MKTFQEFIDEAFVVSAMSGTAAEHAEEFKKKHVAAGGKIINHHVRRESTTSPEMHTVLASHAGKKTVHMFSDINHEAQYDRVRKSGGKSTYQTRTANKMDTPKVPNHGNLG